MQQRRYNAWKPDIKEKIDDQTSNSSGVRGISHNLDVHKNTVITHLKKTEQVNPYILDRHEAGQLSSLETVLYYSSEWGEF